MHRDQCDLFTPVCFLSVHGSIIWSLHLPPSLHTLIQWTHPEKKKRKVFDQAAQICQSPQGRGEQECKTEKGEGHEGLHRAAQIFKKPLMPHVLGILASVLVANANILAAAVAPSGGRLEALTK